MTCRRFLLNQQIGDQITWCIETANPDVFLTGSKDTNGDVDPYNHSQLCNKCKRHTIAAGDRLLFRLEANFNQSSESVKVILSLNGAEVRTCTLEKNGEDTSLMAVRAE